MKNLSTDSVITELVQAYCTETTTARERHVYCEALRGLVRLAKSEQMLEMKANVDRLTGNLNARMARRRTKAILIAQRLAASERGQKQFEFNQR